MNFHCHEKQRIKAVDLGDLAVPVSGYRKWRLEVIAVVTMKIGLLWIMTPCSLVVVYWRLKETCYPCHVRLDVGTFLPDCSKSSGNLRITKKLSHFHHKSHVDFPVIEPRSSWQKPTRNNWCETSRVYRPNAPLRSNRASGNSPENTLFVPLPLVFVRLSCQTARRPASTACDAQHRIKGRRLCVYVRRLLQSRQPAAGYALYNIIHS